MNKDWNLTWMG